MKKKGIVIGVKGAITVIGIALFVLAGIGSTDESSSSDSGGKNGKKIKPEQVNDFGNSVKIDDLQITPYKKEIKTSFGDKWGINTVKAPEGGYLLCIRYKYKNISSKPTSSSPNIKLLDPNGTEYDSDTGKTITYITAVMKSNAKSISKHNPGITLREGKVFEISRSMWKKKGWKLKITKGLFGSGSPKYIKLN